jgi:hypothetical protein
VLPDPTADQAMRLILTAVLVALSLSAAIVPVLVLSVREPGRRRKVPSLSGPAYSLRRTRSDPHSPSSTNSPESRAARQMS